MSLLFYVIGFVVLVALLPVLGEILAGIGFILALVLQNRKCSWTFLGVGILLLITLLAYLAPR